MLFFMPKGEKSQVKIQIEEFYSLPQLVKQPWFPVKSVITLRKMIDNGEIRAVDVGQGSRKWRRVYKDAAVEYLRKNVK